MAKAEVNEALEAGQYEEVEPTFGIGDRHKNARFPICCCNVHITRGMAAVYVMSIVATLLFLIPWYVHSDVLPLPFVVLASVNSVLMTLACALALVGLSRQCTRASSLFFVAQAVNILVALAEIGLFIYIVSMPPEVESRYHSQWQERYASQPVDERISFETYKLLNQLRFSCIYILRDLCAIALSIYFLYAASTLRQYMRGR